MFSDNLEESKKIDMVIRKPFENMCHDIKYKCKGDITYIMGTYKDKTLIISQHKIQNTFIFDVNYTRIYVGMSIVRILQLLKSIMEGNYNFQFSEKDKELIKFTVDWDNNNNPNNNIIVKYPWLFSL
jgi:hypothetical protein